MESFGAALRKAREARGLDLQKAANETHISVEYLDGLEKELFSIFPGETYLMGFMRNYAEFLNLDADELISIYHTVKKQIEPAPLDLLLEPKKKIPWYALIGTGVVLVVAIIATVLIVSYNMNREKNVSQVVVSEPTVSVYELGNVPMEKRLYAGDVIDVPLQNDTVKIEVVDTFGVLTLDLPTGTHIVELGEEVEFDLDGVPGGEISVYLSDISERDSSRGAELQIVRISPLTEALTNDVVEEDPVVEEVVIEIETPTIEVSTDNYKMVIFEGPSAYPVTLNAVFRGQCLFRYQIDRKDTVEDIYSSGETVSISANNAFRLWMSNANTVKLQVIGGGRTVDLEMGRAGQVLVEDIKWIRDENGRYKLVVVEVD